MAAEQQPDEQLDFEPNPDASPMTPHTLMRNALAMMLENSTTHCRKDPLVQEHQYQLSYGLGTSTMAQSTIAPTGSNHPLHHPDQSSSCSSSSHQQIYEHAGVRPSRYGVMEDSYYEDGLNGNLPGGWPEAKLTPSGNGEGREALADGHAEQNAGSDDGGESSGISSCCTSHTKSNDNIKGAAAADPSDYSEQRRKDPTAPTHRAQFTFIPRHSD